MTKEGHHLDPTDWDDFGRDMHDLLDTCLTRMQGARDLPWQQKPADMGVELDGAATPTADVFTQITDTVMPYATGNTHPAFFGWVHGTGLPVGVGAEIIAATMNSNCGGRDHGAAEVEREVINWLTRTAGMPDDAFGILTTGTSQATILALSAARARAFGMDVRTKGIRALPEVRVYMANGAHSCVAKALEIMGHGSDCVRQIPVNDMSQMDMTALKDAIAEDRENGLAPLAIIGTAGSVGVGAYDDFNALADLAAQESIWMHVDAAFGYWSRLADSPYRELSDGIGRADSIALDTHKWPGVQYDCGACLISDRDLHRSTFSSRPAYLESAASGLAGGDLWFCDYGIELSRGFKALKVWTAIKALGANAMGQAITDNCKQAALMADLVAASPHLNLQHDVISNLCCFSVAKGDVTKIAADLQNAGQGVFSTITVNDIPCLRAAIVGHRTTSDDIRAAIKAVEATQI
ncbi:pyridoxal-dependent decarboxylase [Octadecabacter sp.]|jgi:aromatic-L-amino-acid decarboxylase|nr:pyridoxal-dependent decarboxylase [Octadecabacter sp.]MDC1430224.1 pyridoxal-dependent decarboxylase [Octadecabacter sp.]